MSFEIINPESLGAPLQTAAVAAAWARRAAARRRDRLQRRSWRRWLLASLSV